MMTSRCITSIGQDGFGAGADYVTIPNNVTISAGQRYALITIIPLVDIDPTWRPFRAPSFSSLQPSPISTVLLHDEFAVASRRNLYLEDDCLPPTATTVTNLPDCTFHICMPGTNRAELLPASDDEPLTDWAPALHQYGGQGRH